MERAPFEWGQGVEREREIPPRVERPLPSGRPALGQPYIWAAPRKRPRFRYVDDTPKMGRVASAAFLGFLVLLAFGAVWVVERDFEGPSTNAEPVPQTAALEPQIEPPAPSVVERSDPQTSAPEGTPASAQTRLEPPPVIGTQEPPATAPAPRRTETPRPDADARPQTPPPSRTRVPFPTQPPLSQQVTRPPVVEPSPAPPRVTPEPVPAPPLPRVAVEEAVITPPATPPSELPPPPASAVAPPPAPAVASPAPTRPAPAAAPTTAARPPAADVENTAIRDVLGRYRSAFNSLDAKAAQQVWPSVNERTLDRAFGQLQQQNVSFERCTIAVKGVMAEANCNGTTRFVPRVGSRSEQIESRQWNFSLRKAYSGGWVIQDVEAR